jgi:histone H3/H4
MGEQAPEKSRELLIVQSKVREIVRGRDKRVSEDFLDALSQHVHATIEKAIARATANGRSTLRDMEV